MPLRRTRLLFCLWSLLLPLTAQELPVDSAVLGRTIAAKALVAAGGLNAISTFKDYSAKGQITYHLAQDLSGGVTIRGRGLAQLRVDADLAGGRRSEITNKGEVELITEEGQRKVISSQAPSISPKFIFPSLLLRLALYSPGFRVSYRGIKSISGKSVYHLRLEPNLPNAPKSVDADVQTKHQATDLFIDTSTFQIVQLEDEISDHNIRRIRFDDYRAVGSILLPFAIRQTGGYQPCSIRLDQIVLNTGLFDSEFQF